MDALKAGFYPYDEETCRKAEHARVRGPHAALAFLADENKGLKAANTRLEASLEDARKHSKAYVRRNLDLEKERGFLQARVDELEALQRRHEGAVHAAYFAAWNECAQQVEKAAYAARNANPETILNLMGEHA